MYTYPLPAHCIICRAFGSHDWYPYKKKFKKKARGSKEVPDETMRIKFLYQGTFSSSFMWPMWSNGPVDHKFSILVRWNNIARAKRFPMKRWRWTSPMTLYLHRFSCIQCGQIFLHRTHRSAKRPVLILPCWTAVIVATGWRSKFMRGFASQPLRFDAMAMRKHRIVLWSLNSRV